MFNMKAFFQNNVDSKREYIIVLADGKGKAWQ